MRVPLIAGNWKMNTTVGEAVKLADELRQGLEGKDNVEKILCPPFVSLAPVREVIKGSTLKLGAQNMHFERKGAYTGEISALMISDLCEFAIIGHSERRQYFGETGEIVNKKVKAAVAVGLKPILCIGERLEENETGRTETVITEQLRSSLAGIDYANHLVIAYEPVWAIGTGKAATGEQANATVGFIRHITAELFGGATGIRVLYGGSVTAANAAEFIQQPEIDGALVGGASLKAAEFLSIIKQTSDFRS